MNTFHNPFDGLLMALGIVAVLRRGAKVERFTFET